MPRISPYFIFKKFLLLIVVWYSSSLLVFDGWEYHFYIMMLSVRLWWWCSKIFKILETLISSNLISKIWWTRAVNSKLKKIIKETALVFLRNAITDNCIHLNNNVPEYSIRIVSYLHNTPTHTFIFWLVIHHNNL